MPIINPDLQKLEEFLNNRATASVDLEETVKSIVNRVKSEGDKVLVELSKQFEDTDVVAPFLVSKKEMEEAEKSLDPEVLESLKFAAERIRKYHEKQKQESWSDEEDGITTGMIVRPLEAVGIYAPGGKASYPSTVLMDAIPAKVAGCERVVLCTPPGKYLTKEVLAAAKIAEVDEVYAVSGTPSIAAMAFGTESIAPVDMICGPGNAYITEAKRQVQNKVRIDKPAGPSDVLIIADKNTNPAYAAADLLAQLEHEEGACAYLVTTDENLIGKVIDEVEKQKENLSRKNIINVSWENNGVLISVKSIEEAVKISNRVAPEHLQIMTEDPYEVLPGIKNAGAIFLGHYAPVPLGDYVAGPNHVLPTDGSARWSSPLNVDDFIKKSSLLHVTEKGFKKLKSAGECLAEREGFTAHRDSIKIRNCKL